MKKLLIIVLLIATALCINVTAQPNRESPKGPPTPPSPGMMGMGQQGQPPMQQSMMHSMMMPPVMKAGNEGVFLLTGQRLTKYSPSTLKKIASVDLQMNNQQQSDKKDQHGPGMNQQFMGPGGPSEMLLSGSDILIVSPNSFVRVDSKTMKLMVKTSLGDAGMGNQGRMGMGNNQGGMQMGPPSGGPGMMRNALELLGGILYYLNGDRLMAISINDGKTIATAAMENQEPMRQNQPMPMNQPK